MPPKILLLNASAAMLLLIATAVIANRFNDVPEAVAFGHVSSNKPRQSEESISPASHSRASSRPEVLSRQASATQRPTGTRRSAFHSPTGIVGENRPATSSTHSSRDKRPASASTSLGQSTEETSHAELHSGTNSPSPDSGLIPATASTADVIHFDGLRIEVLGHDKPENGGGLLIAVTPADQVSKSSATPSGLPHGFTHEEELFRAKWGWEAFDQAKRAASESLEQAVR